MNPSNQTPPSLFLNFFRWFCKPELLEEIEGDLVEQYQNRYTTLGPLRAKLGFAKEVILLFRPAIYGNFRTKLLWIFGSSDQQRGVLFVILISIFHLCLNKEYDEHALLLTAVTLFLKDMVQLVQLKRNEQVLVTNVLIETLKRDLSFRLIVMSVFFVLYYLGLYALEI